MIAIRISDITCPTSDMRHETWHETSHLRARGTRAFGHLRTHTELSSTSTEFGGCGGKFSMSAKVSECARAKKYGKRQSGKTKWEETEWEETE